MTDITTYSDDYWALSEDVRDKVDVKQQGDPIDVEDSIDSATGSVQSWWVEGTGLDYPADLPDPSSLKDENSLLADATEYLAASQEHEKHTENVRAYQDEDRNERKFVFLENRAHKKFDAWITLYGYDEPGSADDDGSSGGKSAFGTPGFGVGSIGTLVDTPTKQGSTSQYDSEDYDNG